MPCRTTPQGQPARTYRHRSFFVGADMRAAVKQGLADYVPMSAARVPGLMAIGRIKVDVAFIQVSLARRVRLCQPGCVGGRDPGCRGQGAPGGGRDQPGHAAQHGRLHAAPDQIHHLGAVDTPVIEYQPEPGARRDAADRALHRRHHRRRLHAADRPGPRHHEALKHLADRKDIGIHSDVITDAIIPLLEKGILTGRCKTHQPGKIVTSFAMGSRKLYDLIDRNPLFCFQPMDVVCDPATLAAQHKMVSVTQAFCGGSDRPGLPIRSTATSTAAWPRRWSSCRVRRARPAASPSSAWPARPTTAARASAPCCCPGEAAGIARTDVHYVITEFGIAYLFGKSIRERAWR
jgi:hypothetical protein